MTTTPQNIRLLRDGDLDEPEVSITSAVTPAVARASIKLRSRINIASELLRARVKMGWTQKQLAIAARTRQSRISELESMNGNPRFSTLDHVAQALGLEVTLRSRRNASIEASDFVATNPIQKQSNVSMQTDVISMLEESWALLTKSFEKISLPSENKHLHGPMERRRASGGGAA